MTHTTSSFRLGPEFTPEAIKKLILYTCVISLIAAITNNLFVFLFGIPGPMDWLSLSWWGMKKYLLWQPVTFLFTHHTGGAGINFFFLLTLFFNMYILWIFGSDIYHRVGTKPFLRLYFISGILSGMLAFLLMPITGQYDVLSGATPSILALLIVWTLMNPESQLLLFFLIPVKAKWLTLGIVGSIILITLSNVDIVHFTLYLSAAAIGYFYALVAWGLHSPFPALYKFELSVTRFSRRIQDNFTSLISKFKNNGNKQSKKKKGEVVDFTTGKPLKDDDKFVDAMLEKISKYGEQSLTWQERERMQNISQKRSKKNQ